ncbi:TetR family transcriptional regulator, partial [Mesorhizobium japonicum]
EALKSASMAEAMTRALADRGVSDATAALAAELGVLAFKRGFASWSAGDREDEFAPHALAALAELRTAAAGLG